MKFPKSLIIGGIKWKVIFDKKTFGGAFYWQNHIIKIEKKYSDERKFNTLIHEIIEIIMVNNSLRYQPNYTEIANGDYLFSFGHKEFETLTNEISGVLKQFMK